MGQHTVFDSASEILKCTLGIDLSAKQIQRVSEWYGEQIDPIIESNHTEYMVQLDEPKTKDEMTYVMVDGSMLYTREEQWKEMKLARMFHQGQNIGIQRNRNEIVKSVYVSHLGSKDEFFPKVERHLSLIQTRKIFIADGAQYIWNWVEDNYPGAIQILDFYHAVEKIENLARLHFTDEEAKKQWLQEQRKLMLDDKVEQVIVNLKGFKPRSTETTKARDTAVHYFIQHTDRMMYKTYRDQGLLIGSGPIEAAHRTVIQQRLKLSGQKWSIPGARAIANLRCYHLSGAWNTIENLIRLAA